MADEKVPKVVKTYQSLRPGFSTSVQVAGGKRVQVQFIAKPKGHGEFSTDDAEVQAHIEKLDAFRIGDIRVKWSPLQKAEARVAAAEKAVSDANTELSAAKAELAGLKKPEPAPKK